MKMKGAGGGMVGAALALIVLGVFMIFGPFVFGAVDNAATGVYESVNSADLNAVREDVQGNFYDAMGIIAIVLILGAVALIFVVLRGMG